MSNCYSVIMATGEYADRNEYTLKVFGSKNGAQEFAETIRSQLDNLGRHSDGNNQNSHHHKQVIKLNGFDIDGNGARIRVDGPFPFEG